MSGVVVGVDGSEQSFAALRLAAQEARWRGTHLHIAHAFSPSRSSATAAAATVASSDGPSGTGVRLLQDARRRDDDDRADQQRNAQGRLHGLIAESGVDLDGLDVERSALADEHVAAALVRLSRNADLLVVGSRGRGGFAGLLLGSVGQQCVNYASCPVLVTRG